jgi:hypothetical protein
MVEIKNCKITFDLIIGLNILKKMFKKLLFHYTAEIKNHFSMDSQYQNYCHAISFQQLLGISIQ